MSLRSSKKHFRVPPKTFGPAVIWEWNDHLDLQRLVAQLDEIADAGFQSLLIRPGKGLPPGGRQDKTWYDALGAVSKRARRRGVALGLHERLESPSDVFTHSIRKGNPHACMMQLHIEDIVLSDTTLHEFISLTDPSANPSGSAIVAFFVMNEENASGFHRARHHNFPTQVEPILFDIDPGKWLGYRVLVFRAERDEKQFNFLDRRATDALLQKYYDEAAQHLRLNFGSSFDLSLLECDGIPLTPNSIPWDPELDTLFRETRGYSLVPHLPSLFFDLPGCEVIRYEYWKMIAAMYRGEFLVPLREWCSEHKVDFASTNTITPKHFTLPGNMARHAQSHKVCLTVSETNFSISDQGVSISDECLVAIKEATSVSGQMALQGTMALWDGGGSFTGALRDVNRLARLLMVLGVTKLHHSTFPHSLRGERIETVTAIFGSQQPHWTFISEYSNELARTSELLSSGKRQCDVLMLHPRSSLQSLYHHSQQDSSDLHPYQRIHQHFLKLSGTLFDAGVDFDYADEDLLASKGGTGAKTISLGEQTYKLVLLPPTVNLRSGTLELLLDFAMGGGEIVIAGSAPTLLNGKPSEELARFVDEYTTRIVEGIDFFSYQGVVDHLKSYAGLKVFTKDGLEEESSGFVCHHRASGEFEYRYVVNTSATPRDVDLQFTVGVEGHLEEWDPASGEIGGRCACSSDEELTISSHWEPFQARFYVATPEPYRESPPKIDALTSRDVNVRWKAKRNQPNVYPLGSCTVSNAPEECTLYGSTGVRALLAQRIHFEKSAAVLSTQWTFECSSILPVTGGCEVALEMGDLSDTLPENEQPSVAFNGEPVPLESQGTLLDPARIRLALPQPNVGVNVLEVTRRYDEPEDFSAPILLGNFWVNSEDLQQEVLEFTPEWVESGIWEQLGMPYYIGTVTYSATVNPPENGKDTTLTLELSGLLGAAELRVNGNVVARLVQPSAQYDITSFRKKGALEIEIEVAANLASLINKYTRDSAPNYTVEKTPIRRSYGLTQPAKLLIATKTTPPPKTKQKTPESEPEETP